MPRARRRRRPRPRRRCGIEGGKGGCVCERAPPPPLLTHAHARKHLHTHTHTHSPPVGFGRFAARRLFVGQHFEGGQGCVSGVCRGRRRQLHTRAGGAPATGRARAGGAQGEVATEKRGIGDGVCFDVDFTSVLLSPALSLSTGVGGPHTRLPISHTRNTHTRSITHHPNAPHHASSSRPARYTTPHPAACASACCPRRPSGSQ